MKRRLCNLNRNHKGDDCDDNTRQEQASELRLAEQIDETPDPEGAHCGPGCPCEDGDEIRARLAGPAGVEGFGKKITPQDPA